MVCLRFSSFLVETSFLVGIDLLQSAGLEEEWDGCMTPAKRFSQGLHVAVLPLRFAHVACVAAVFARNEPDLRGFCWVSMLFKL